MRPFADRFLVLIFAASIAARVCLLLSFSHPEILDGQFEFQHDEAEYHRLAASLADSGSYSLGPDEPPTVRRSPGLVIPLAVLYFVFGPSPLLAVGYVLACSVLLQPIAVLLASRISEARFLCYLSAAVVAFLPSLLFTSIGIWSEPPALLFMLLSLYLFLRIEEGQSGAYWALAGLSLSLSYLNRTAILFLFPLIVVRIFSSPKLRRQWKGVTVFSVSLLLPIAAWGLRNFHHFGEFFISEGTAARTLWEANNPVTAGIARPAIRERNGYDVHAESASGAYLGSWVPELYIADGKQQNSSDTELEKYNDYLEKTVDFVRSNPAAWLRLELFKLRRLFTAAPLAPSILGESPSVRLAKRLVTASERWFLLVFGLSGLVALLKARHPSGPYFLMYLGAGLVTVLLVYVNARIFLPAAVALVVPAAHGLSSSIAFLRRKALHTGR